MVRVRICARKLPNSRAKVRREVRSPVWKIFGTTFSQKHTCIHDEQINPQQNGCMIIHAL